MRKKGKMIIWPAYFDSTKTRGEGRRVPKNLAVPSPKISEIKEAVEKLSLDYEGVLDVGYPKTPWLKTGILLVTKKEPKEQTITKISKHLLRIRGDTPAAPHTRSEKPSISPNKQESSLRTRKREKAS